MSPTAREAMAPRRTLRVGSVVVAAELLLIVVHFAVTEQVATIPRYVLYPFVWINLGLWAVWRVDVPTASADQRWLAGTVAAGYVLVLFWLAGLLGISFAGNPEAILGVSVGTGSPGWERIRLVGRHLYLTLIPYRVIGYLALGYLVYATVLTALRAVAAGAVGLFACVGCSFPVFASLAAGVFGGSAGLTGAVYALTVDLSTLVFVLAVGLLLYQPGVPGTLLTGAAD
jgi:hypothetical protein